MTILLYLTIISIISIGAQISLAFSELITQESGTIGDVTIDGNTIYFFEQDKNIKSPTFLHDTRVMQYDGETLSSVSDELFMYPTELHERGQYLYFVTLSESCKGQIFCDYQDIIQMAKESGKKTILIKDLKSAAHISPENDSIFFSESNGNIWRLNYDDSSKLIYNIDNNLIMDIATDSNAVYWIEEIEDQNSRIMALNKDSNDIEIIDSGLMIPYNIKTYDDSLYWNEIHVKGTGGFGEFTKITTYKDGKKELIRDFRNTSPITNQHTSHYKPYLVEGDYVFAVNNTGIHPIIHLQNFKNQTQYDVATIENYDVKFLRAESDSLYVVGRNDEGYVLERFSLPVTVPEFPSALLLISTSLGLIIFFTTTLKLKDRHVSN